MRNDPVRAAQQAASHRLRTSNERITTDRFSVHSVNRPTRSIPTQACHPQSRDQSTRNRIDRRGCPKHSRKGARRPSISNGPSKLRRLEEADPSRTTMTLLSLSRASACLRPRAVVVALIRLPRHRPPALFLLILASIERGSIIQFRRPTPVWTLIGQGGLPPPAVVECRAGGGMSNPVRAYL